MPANKEEQERSRRKREHEAAQDVGPLDQNLVLKTLNALRGELRDTRVILVGDPETGEKGLVSRFDRTTRVVWVAVIAAALSLTSIAGLGWLYKRVNHNSSETVVVCRSRKATAADNLVVYGPFIKQRLADPTISDFEKNATQRYITNLEKVAHQTC